MQLYRRGELGRRLGARLDASRGGRTTRSLERREAARLKLGATFRESRACFYDAMWRKAAATVGAEVGPLGGEFLIIRRVGHDTLVNQSLVMLDTPVTLELAVDKPLVCTLLHEAGLPTARSQTFGRNDLSSARAFRREARRPVVVKPTGTGAGNGFTGGIEDDDQLTRAVIAVGRTYPSLIVEEGVAGREFRLLYLDGVLLDAVERRRPVLRGDGVTSIAGLVASENRRRAEAGPSEVARPLRLDLDLELSLRRAGRNLSAVLEPGEAITVKSGVSDNCAAENVVADLPRALVDDGACAAQAARLRLAGVDVITPDPGVPLADAGGVVLEVNATPGLHHHYWVQDPCSISEVAVPILECLLRQG